MEGILFLPYNDKFIIGYEADMHRLIEAGFDVRKIKKTEKGVYYRVVEVATCVIDMTDDSVVYLCTDRNGRRFLLTDETGRYMRIEVDKEQNQYPPLTREKPSIPGWYKRVIKTEKKYEFDFVKIDRERETNELRVWSIDGTFDYLSSCGDRYIWSAAPENTTFY